MKKLNTSKLPEDFPVAFSGRAVPIGLNLAMNRCLLPILCVSDSTKILVWFYEYRGLYWFGFQANGKSVNSVPYVSARNCDRGLRLFLRNSSFSFDDPDMAESRIRSWRSSFVPCPASRRV